MFDVLPLLSPHSNNDTNRGKELSTTAHLVNSEDQEQQQPTGKELPDPVKSPSMEKLDSGRQHGTSTKNQTNR